MTLEHRGLSADKKGVTSPDSSVVLLVEDDHGVRRPLEKFLQMHHFKVVTAETADDAIDAIHQHRPTAAIVDLRLARGSGRDVVVSMPAGTPVIIFSGVPSESAELERLRPRTRLVPKPYSLTMLVDALKEMISSAAVPHL
jgi:DNA-binding response OmpR family regulator